MGPSIIDGDTNYVYGAWGPYADSMDCILEFLESQNIAGYKSICDDGNEGRWIIFQSTNMAYIAQGPFRFNVDELVSNEDNWIIGVTLGGDNRFVEMKGLGKACFDHFGDGHFWVISQIHDLNEGEGFCLPPTIPPHHDITEPTFGSVILELPEDVYEAQVDEDVDTMLLELSALCEEGTDRQLVEIEPSQWVDFVGDDTNLGATHGHEGLAPLMPITCLETGDPIAELIQDGAHLHVGEFQSFGPLPNDLDPSLDDNIYAMFGGLLESNEASELGPPSWVDFNNDAIDYEASIVPTNHDAIGTRMEGVDDSDDNGGLASVMQVHGDETLEDNLVQLELDGTHGHFGASHYELEGQQMAEDTIVATSNLGDNNESARKRPWMDKPPCFSLVEVNNDMMEATSIFEPTISDGANGEAWAMPKKARVANLPSPQSVLYIGTNTNGNEDMAPSILGDLMETLEGNALQPLVDEGTSSSTTESQWVSSPKNVEDISKGGEMEDQVVEGAVATTSTNSKGCKPSKKRQRRSKFKQHGVKRREGGRESFVAYFRPKDLPKSNKTFLTIGEFSNERDAWDAFNLFAFVHEGEESCINMVDRDSIEMEAALWRELPRVDLVAHLRLNGRGYFRSNVLPTDSFIPRYRNIKFRLNTQGLDKGKIRWFSDIVLAKGVTNPYVGNGTKNTSTYETAQEAAKEADRLLMLNEGYMAWTNYTIIDYMTENEKDEWDPLWIPLQDNPKKYLSTAKYNSLD